MSIRDYYTNITETGWSFSSAEWNAIVGSGNTAAAISFVANSCVLIVHAFMTWYRPAIVNRLSLRMIVISCICNLIYCACQLVTDEISSQSFSCRALAYVLVASDTMACMCLTMVGLNLVMIFVLKVSKTVKLEILYYLIIVLSGILVSIVPVLVGNPKGPKDETVETSCWFHYYFEGRMNNIFNWMWYYGFLLFSLVFATTCAAISIRFVVKKQENFSGALDMFARRDQKDIATMAIIRKYTNNNTDIFQKIARRCVCYPLVPLISKSWGVGIEIAASQNAYIPVVIFVLDRIFSCLLGFMVSCIYFTDPAIRAVFKESIESIKRRYVYNYYCIQFLPSNDSTIDFNSQYPKLLKITPTPEHYDHTANFIKETRNRYLNQSSGEVEEPIREFRSDTQSPLSITRSLDEPDSSAAFQRKTISPAIKPELPTIRLNQVHGRPVEEVSPHYSIISVTSKNGNTFLPNESTVDLKKSPRHIDDPEHQKKTVNCLPRKSKVKTMPMRRVLDSSVLGNKVDPKGSQTEPHDRASFSKHNETVKTLVPFRWPACAKVIHWTLTKIFRVKTIEIRESDEDNLREYQCGINGKQGEPSRIFRDFTDDSDPGSPPMPARNDSVSFHPDIDLKNTGTSSKAAAFYTHKRFSSLTFDDTSGDEDAASNSVTTTRKDRLTSASSLYNIKQAHSSSIGEKESAHPLRRVSSINIGSLQRARARKLSISTFPFNRQVVERDAEPSSPTTKFVSSIGLTKMLSRGRSMSFSWSKLTSTKGKAGPCPDTSTSALDQTSTVDSEVNNNKEVVEMTELPAESSSKMIGEPIDKDIYNDDLDNLTTDKPGSSRSRSPIPQEIAATLTPSSPAIASTPSPSPSRTEYPMQLSPRPRTQYKKPAVIGHQQRSRQGSATVINAPHFLCRTVKRISKKKKRSSVISTEDTTHMSELVHGASGSPQGPQLPIQSSFYVGEEPEEEMLTIHEQSVPVDNEQEGLSHGHTTISFISNWQDAESVENNRIIGISEAWDLDEQLRKQLEFAEQVSHI